MIFYSVILILNAFAVIFTQGIKYDKIIAQENHICILDGQEVWTLNNELIVSSKEITPHKRNSFLPKKQPNYCQFTVSFDDRSYSTQISWNELMKAGYSAVSVIHFDFKGKVIGADFFAHNISEIETFKSSDELQIQYVVKNHLKGALPKMKSWDGKTSHPGEKTEEVGFLRRYWYIIVPLVILLALPAEDNGEKK